MCSVVCGADVVRYPEYLFKFQKNSWFTEFYKLIEITMTESSLETVNVPVNFLEQVITILRENTESNKQMFSSLVAIVAMVKDLKLVFEGTPKYITSNSGNNISDISVSSGMELGGTDSEKDSVSKSSKTFIYQNSLKENNALWRRSKNSELGKFLSSPQVFISLCKKKCPDLETMRFVLLFISFHIFALTVCSQRTADIAFEHSR